MKTIWEQRKLSDIYASIGNAFVGTATPYYVESGHFYLESNNIKDGQINHNSEIFINDEFYEKQKDKWLHTGDMVMVQSGHVGHAAVIPEELDNSAAHALIMFRHPKEKIEPYFLNYQYQTNKSKKKIEEITTGNTIKHILASDMQEFVVDITNYDEQKKIGSYFQKLDHLITLHQRKCEETKSLKKYMLQKMFPENGNCVPKIRFSGFADAWEQRKLKDYLEVSREKNKTESYGKEDVLSVSGEHGIVNQIEFQGRSFAGVSVANYGVVEAGDVVYTKSPLKSNPYGIIKTNKGKTGIVSTLYAVYKPRMNTNSEFVQIYFELDSRMNSYMHPLVNKGAKNDMKVSDENALKGPVAFPELEEQNAITQYFDKLDRLITLHQRKCYRFIDIALDAWEQRKLGEVAQEFKSGNSLKADEIDITGDYPVYGGNGLRGYTSTYNHDGEYALIGRQGALCGNMNYSVGKAYFTEHAVVVKADENNDTRFLYYMLDTMNLGQYSDQSAQPGLAVNKLVKLENQFPMKEEQQRIGWYFSNIDHLITFTSISVMNYKN